MTKLHALSALRFALFLAASVPAGVALAQDLNVNGSLCVGLDCPPSGGFGFDTIVLRENNLRIFFDDTSVSAGFPANKWRITINDSASGGANFFSVDDATANRSIFKVTAGAPANSLFVASSGNVGLGTAAPGLDLSISTTDTPAIRLEQTAAGGFTAQTWDIGGNEANFFVRDVTGGSRLPLRIRPGAPTSSVDIAASGNVGVGLASPGARMDIKATTAGLVDYLRLTSTTANANNDGQRISWFDAPDAVTVGSIDHIKTAPGVYEFRISNWNGAALGQVMAIDTNGNVGIGAAVPAAQLHTTGSVRFAGVPNCGSGIASNASGTLSCVVSSRHFKNVTGDLPSSIALANVMALRPQVGTYKETPDVPEHWLIAEDVAAVDPALVGLNEGKPYVVKTQNIVADLVAVVQQQQRQIDELKRLVAAK
jgi:hypothetical protein